jgi:hypothetical protein
MAPDLASCSLCNLNQPLTACTRNVPLIQTNEIPVQKKNIYVLLDSSLAGFHKWNLPWWMELSANSVRPEANMRDLIFFWQKAELQDDIFWAGKNPWGMPLPSCGFQLLSRLINSISGRIYFSLVTFSPSPWICPEEGWSLELCHYYDVVWWKSCGGVIIELCQVEERLLSVLLLKIEEWPCLCMPKPNLMDHG